MEPQGAEAPTEPRVAPRRPPAGGLNDTVCEECGAEFRTQFQFDQHHREAHPGSSGGRPLGV